MIDTTHVCDLCGAASAVVGRPAVGVLARPAPIPEGWATVNLTLSERVLPETGRTILGMVDALPAKALVALPPSLVKQGLAQMAHPFHTTFHVCPSCQSGVLWQAAQARLDKENGSASPPAATAGE